MQIQDTEKKMYGTLIDIVADILGKASVAIDNKSTYCAALGQQADVLAGLHGAIFPANRRGP